MTVPALDTSFIGTFAYLQPATEVQIADVLPYLHTYQQYAEYVDGVIRIYENGSSGVYSDVYVRIRTDGWMMAFFPDDAHQGTACWGSYAWILDDYTCRGNVIWWGQTYSGNSNPPTDSTRLGRALSEMWTQLKANSDAPSYTFAYADVGYYDYEFTNATKMYIFGNITYSTETHYFTAPVGTTIYQLCVSYASYVYNQHCHLYINYGTAKQYLIVHGTVYVDFSVKTIPSANIYADGVQNNGRASVDYPSGVRHVFLACILFSSD